MILYFKKARISFMLFLIIQIIVITYGFIYLYNLIDIAKIENNDNSFYLNNIQPSKIGKYYNDLYYIVNTSWQHKVNGASMQPTLFSGNTIICKPNIPYKEGDIIMFKEGDKYIAHRIKSQYSDYLVTQGDNNLYEDTPINHSQVDCVVIGVIY